jgi:hypothetical protein
VGIIRSIVIMPIEGKLGAMISASHHAARGPAARAPLLVGGTLPHINEALLKTRPLYDPVKDLDPISSVAVNAFVLAVQPSVPAHTLKEFAAHAKAQSGKMSYARAHGPPPLPQQDECLCFGAKYRSLNDRRRPGCAGQGLGRHAEFRLALRIPVRAPLASGLIETCPCARAWAWGARVARHLFRRA